jgi:hypothetical protein
VESRPFPLIGRGEGGTRNAIAMLLMSLGLVETVKLMPGYEWVRVLRRIGREQAEDGELRARWWAIARELAEQFRRDDQVGGVAVIGDLLQEQPLHRWSVLHLMIWEVPESAPGVRVREGLGVPVEVTEVVWASPADWRLMQQGMTVLVGNWRGQESPGLEQRSMFRWVEDGK